MDTFDQDAQQNKLYEKKRRLAVLETEAAKRGFETPTAVQAEIAAIKQDIRMLEPPVRSPISPDVAEVLGPAAALQATNYWFQLLFQRLADRDKFDAEYRAQQERLTLDYREQREKSEQALARTFQRAMRFVALFYVALFIAFLLLVLAVFGSIGWLLIHYVLTPR